MGSKLREVADLDQLGSQLTHADGYLAFVRGIGEWYCYNAASIAVHNGDTVIRPINVTGGMAGRWEKDEAGAAPSPVSSVAPITIIRETSNNTLTLNETPTADDVLVLPVLAGEAWLVEAHLELGEQLGAYGLKIGFGVPALSVGEAFHRILTVLEGNPYNWHVSDPGLISTFDKDDDFGGGAARGDATALLTARVVAGADGNITILYAQAESSASQLKIKATSRLVAYKLS